MDRPPGPSVSGVGETASAAVDMGDGLGKVAVVAPSRRRPRTAGARPSAESSGKPVDAAHALQNPLRKAAVEPPTAPALAERGSDSAAVAKPVVRRAAAATTPGGGSTTSVAAASHAPADPTAGALDRIERLLTSMSTAITSLASRVEKIEAHTGLATAGDLKPVEDSDEVDRE